VTPAVAPARPVSRCGRPNAGHCCRMSSKRLRDRIPHWGAHITFWDFAIRTVLTVSALAVGWWTTAQAWAEGIIKPYGTLGYVAVILCVALALALTFAICAWGLSNWSYFRKYRAPSKLHSMEKARDSSSIELENDARKASQTKSFHWMGKDT
jgi:hypothetical protein